MSTNTFNQSGADRTSLLRNAILWLVLLMTVIAVFVPFSPEMPAPSLDPSWQFGMNQAVAQGLSFGTEMIFTYGPYAFIYTKLYHPATDDLMMAGSLYLALSYFACFFFVMNRATWPWILINGVCLAGLMYFRDPLLFLYPLLAGLGTFKILFSEDRRLSTSRFTPVYVALLFAPFGLLPLIKGSLLIWCGAIAVLCSVFFMVAKQRMLALLCLISPLASMVFFWSAVGLPPATLSQYFINMTHIVSGYTEAMGISGPISEIILYMAASLVVLIAIAAHKQLSLTPKLFLLLIYSLFVFFSYKAGFIRHDDHAVITGTALLFATLLLPCVLPNRTIIPVMMIVGLVWFHIDRHYIQTTPRGFSTHLLSTYASAWRGLQSRSESPHSPRSDFDAAVHSLRQQAAFPVLPGTTDIYSYNQSYLIASGNTWSPRPILQSYSAYTPALAEINKQHLLGNRAPDNIIFRVEPIDGRMPSTEDGTSWPILLRHYQPIEMENEFLFLRYREHIGGIGEPWQLSAEHHTFGERVRVPRSSQPIMAHIEIRPTMLGRIASLMFKPTPLYMTLELKGDMSKKYRIISGMAKSGFLISPLIENTGEFGMLYGPQKFLDNKTVTSIAISTWDVGIKLWDEEYTVIFSRLNTAAPVDIFKIYKFDEFDESLSDFKATIAAECDGNIDSINDASPAPPTFAGSTLLKVNGWVAASVEETILPEAVYVVLTDEQGRHHYLRTRRTSRPDVGTQFKKPELVQTGYNMLADISGMEGPYTIGLAIKVSGTIRLCPNLSIPITIAN